MAEIIGFLPQLLRGARVTLIVWSLAAVLSAVFALLGGLGRLSERRPVRWVAGAYIETFRGTSVLVQMFWFFFALPILLGIELSPITAGVLALAMNVGAYGSEVVRGAIQAVPKGQREAAIAVNFTSRQRMRRVILPQAIPMMLPPFGNLLIELLKGTALVSLISITDLTQAAQLLRSRTGATVELYLTILVIYFIIA
ncbi:MAG: ectoine/hydroxyectoine ABC transporter permease subunit EhuC, partial [Euzebyales bacterium]|nr:ectoine/hydroxyectoine ABC transporter permease subunit EhuC [Euzebyales bacterium]